MVCVQLFAYEVDTHNSDKMNEIMGRQGADPNEMSQEQYIHLQANLQVRLIQRYALPIIESRAEVLPVFLAPEFFFKWHSGEPYERPAFLNSLEYLASLSSAFPTVLWAPGTVWWKEPYIPQKEGPQEPRDHAIVHNSALVFHNGRLLCSWQKERLSDIDGLRRGPEVWDRWDDHSRRILDDTQSPFFSVIDSHGRQLSCGIEVCLDHRSLQPQRGEHPDFGILRTRYCSQYENGAGVDLHILTAAGIPLQPENIVSRRGGVIVRCDGGSGASSRSECHLVRRGEGSPASALRQWSPQLDPAAVEYWGKDPDNRLAIYAPVRLNE